MSEGYYVDHEFVISHNIRGHVTGITAVSFTLETHLCYNGEYRSGYGRSISLFATGPLRLEGKNMYGYWSIKIVQQRRPAEMVPCGQQSFNCSRKIWGQTR